MDSENSCLREGTIVANPDASAYNVPIHCPCFNGHSSVSAFKVPASCENRDSLESHARRECYVSVVSGVGGVGSRAWPALSSLSI